MAAKTSNRKFTAEFKKQLVLGVLKERQTLAELAKIDLLSISIVQDASAWGLL